jgi:hypothetical protein
MFVLTLPNGASLRALNHLPVEKQVRQNSRYSLPKVNYFKWVAYPERSEGSILVSEISLREAIDFGEITTDLACTLTITDGIVTNTFEGIAISGIEVFNSGIEDSIVDYNKRLLKISFYISRGITDTTMGYCPIGSYYSGRHFTWSSLVGMMYYNPSLLLTPTIFNQYINYENIMLDELYAFVANMQFVTAYPNPLDDKCLLTSASFDPALINVDSILFVDSGRTLKRMKISTVFPTYDYRFGVLKYYSSSGVDLSSTYAVPPTDTDIKITDLLTPEQVTLTFPFQLINPSTSSNAFIGLYHDLISQNCTNRFSSRIHMVLRGVSAQSIMNDLHRITYAYDQRGFTTTLESIDWELPKLNLLDQSTNDVLFIATLLADMSASIVPANIFHPLNSVTPVESGALIYDPLGLVTRYCKGTRCYVIRTYEGEYIVVSGPCPPTTPCASSSSGSEPAPLGSCLYGSPGEPSCTINTQAACNTLGGIWTAGGSCP